MKILTLNTHKGFASFNRRFVLHELRDAIRSVSADIVFLQEVVGLHEDYSTRYEKWPAAPQYEFLADTIWKSVAYGRNAVYQLGHHGNALLSKYPIIRHRNVDASSGVNERRGLLHTVLRNPLNGTEMHAICVHFGLRDAERRHQIERLCDLVQRDVPADAPLSIAGDFNDWLLRGHALIRRCAGVREVFGYDNHKPARTFPAGWPLLRLDRIYLRNARLRTSTVLSKRPWSHLSDHAALLAEVEF